MSRLSPDWYLNFQANNIGPDTQWVFDNATIADILRLPSGQSIALLALKEILRCPYGDKANSYSAYIRFHLEENDKPLLDAIDNAIKNMSSDRLT